MVPRQEAECGAQLYSTRDPNNPGFPFQTWNEMMHDVQTTIDQESVQDLHIRDLAVSVPLPAISVLVDEC